MIEIIKLQKKCSPPRVQYTLKLNNINCKISKPFLVIGRSNCKKINLHGDKMRSFFIKFVLYYRLKFYYILCFFLYFYVFMYQLYWTHAHNNCDEQTTRYAVSFTVCFCISFFLSPSVRLRLYCFASVFFSVLQNYK